LGSQGNGTCEDANTHLQIAQAHILNITAAKYDLQFTQLVETEKNIPES
jgi:hypothetical protein